jgi:6-phosphofructokinase 1
VSFATECLDRLHVTAQAHRRVLVVEVMGRHAGWTALSAGRRHAIVVVAEGAHPEGGTAVVKGREIGRAELLGGVGERVAEELQERTGCETRALSLGYLVRGGSPGAFDRVLGLVFGTAAVRALADGHDGVMVAINPPRIDYVPLADAIARMKRVPLDGEGILTARSLGIALGD